MSSMPQAAIALTSACAAPYRSFQPSPSIAPSRSDQNRSSDERVGAYRACAPPLPRARSREPENLLVGGSVHTDNVWSETLAALLVRPGSPLNAEQRPPRMR